MIILRYRQLEPLIETLKGYHTLFSSDIFCQKSCNVLSSRNEFKWDNYIIQENNQDMALEGFVLCVIRKGKEVWEMVSLRINASYPEVETRLPLIFFSFPVVTFRPPSLNSALMWTGSLCLISGYLTCPQCCSALCGTGSLYFVTGKASLWLKK